MSAPRVPLLAGIAICAAIFGLVAQGPGTPLDPRVLGWFREAQTPAMRGLFGAITLLGDSNFVAAATALATLALLAAQRPRDAVLLAGCVFAAALLSTELKMLFDRVRPTGRLYSFPSGHAALAMAFYASLAFLFTRERHRAFARLAMAGAWIVAAAVGVSRLYLGVHWLGDVVAGEALGFAAFLLLVYARYVTTRSPTPSTCPSSLSPALTGPTPAGVPEKMRSPGCSVMRLDR